MQNTSSPINLNEAILQLEIEQEKKRKLLKEQFHIATESLKPAHLLKSTIKDISLSPQLMTDMLGTGMGLVTGYLSKKIVVAGSDNIFRKLLGTIVQMSVANIVAQHPEAIKSIGQFIFEFVSSKKETETNEE